MHLVRKAAVLAAALLLCGNTASAEEKRLGDFIYVPAMTANERVGTMSLRVQGLALTQQSDEASSVDCLAGAEFGVYVVSGDGTLTPWANPLYPSEPMRIRTGDEPVSFTLPDTAEFYLIQHSAPQGYVFDADAVIPVVGGEIVVTNEMPGELVICAEDSLGEPIEGVSVTLQAQQDGACETMITDEKGQIVLHGSDIAYTISESARPMGVYEALGVRVDGVELQQTQAQVQLKRAARSRVTFVHPATGSVQLSMQLACVDEDGGMAYSPLKGVEVEIEADPPVRMATDDKGQAQASLLEGTYVIRFAYAGEKELVLPFSEAQMIVQSGAATVIELNAADAKGRVVLNAQTEDALVGGSYTLENIYTGESFGPFALQADGVAVSSPLAAGEYRISEFIAPTDCIAGAFRTQEQALESMDELVVCVLPGTATQVGVELLKRERQQYALFARRVTEDGAIADETLSGELDLELLNAQGEFVAQLHAQDGLATIEALSGSYMLHMDEQLALKLGMQENSLPFELPAQHDGVVFASSEGRLILTSVNQNGEPVYGASYLVTDAEGMQHTVVCNEYGEGITPELPAGEAHIATLTAPDGHTAAPETMAELVGGEALRLSLMHESYGCAQLDVQMLKLDESGRTTYSPLASASLELYRVSAEDGRLMDTGLVLLTEESGSAEVSLEEGEYVAKTHAESLPEGCLAGEEARFVVRNGESTQAQLIVLDALGGLRVTLLGADVTRELLAQTRFALAGADGTEYDLTLMDGGYYAGKLAAGEYVLRQTQIPQGYTRAEDRSVIIAQAQITSVDVALEEYAVVSVSKTGLTFNDSLQTFVVPLEGQYGLYTMTDGEMTPYPSGEEQMTVWANVSPEQIAQGKNAQLRLPAPAEGTTYFLREIGAAQGFAADEEYHEVTLAAGEQATVYCTVSSDRGFFELAQLDASTHEHVSGGAYELVDAAGETALTFTLDAQAYRNEMAVPVGIYTLRQLEAGDGYALSDENEITIEIDPYLTQGGSVTSAQMESIRIPTDAQMTMIRDMYAAREQGITLLSVDGGALEAGYALRQPQMLLELQEESGARVSVLSVVLASVQDEKGTPYKARVEYCLTSGGWQPSDARMTGAISGPTTVSLSDVEEDICAVRVTYLNAQTGVELVGDGFTPGQATLGVRVGAQEKANVKVAAQFSGLLAYRVQEGGALELLERVSRQEQVFEAEGDGLFESACAGRDGRIGGTVFFDVNADGLMDASEGSRYAGMNVRLLNESGEQIASVRTDSAGGYQFNALSAGSYTVQFEAGEEMIFSRGGLGSEHVASGVEDARYGMSGSIRIDGDHTDYVVNAGCMYAAKLSGSVSEMNADGALHGLGGISVELYAKSGADDEPAVVMTDDMGRFRFDRIQEGEYEAMLRLPQGYLSEEAQEGVIQRNIVFTQGEDVSFGDVIVTRATGIFGFVCVDENGDGQFGQEAQTLEGVKVVLLRVKDGFAEQVAQTVTAADGAYAFENLYPGEYSVLFELNGEWTFTRYGEDSHVYGAVSQNGSTKTMTLAPGDQAYGINVGVTVPAQLTVMVFEDTYADGEKGVYENGLEGVSVSLIRMENGEEAEAIAAVSDAQGMVSFEGVSPGEYVLGYRMPGLWRATRQVDPQTTQYPVSCVPQSTMNTGRSLPFTLTMGQKGQTLYIGAMLSGSISGEAFFDDDANAMLDASEAYCAGVGVELLNAQGERLAQTSTDENGAYEFAGVAPGRYRVRFTAEEGCGFSATERTMARGGVQASTENVSETRSITVAAGQGVTGANAGVVRLCAISGVIWEDRNADCAVDASEKGMANVTVNLMDGAGRTILAVTTTDENGAFTFDQLSPDTYKLRVDAPQDYVFSGALAGGALGLETQRNRRAYSQPFALLGGVQAQGVGFGLLTQGTISGCVWEDRNYNAIWEQGEEGLRGVLLTLNDLFGNQVAQTTSLRSGEFAFKELMPGEYTLSATLPEGYVFTCANGESVLFDSDKTSESVYLGTLEMGATLSELQIGALKPASVGGTVWYDRDNDGRRQSGHEGVKNVLVKLLMLSGADEGLELSTTTDDNGEYSFDAVLPGEAELTFTLEEGYAFARQVSGAGRVSVVPQTDALTASTEALIIQSGASADGLDVGVVGVGTISGRVWADSDYNGRIGKAEVGAEGVLVALLDAKSGETLGSAVTNEAGEYRLEFVRVGEYQLEFTLRDGMIFTCEGESAISMVDASQARTEQLKVQMGESLSGVNVGAIVPASVSGQIKLDVNKDGICSEDEPGMAGATVTLMQGGMVTSTTQTQDDGGFTLDLIRPGTYRVRVALGQDALFSKQDILSLAHADAQEGETGEFVLEMGQNVMLAPIAAVRGAEISGYAWLDQNVNGLMDANEPMLEGVQVELLGGENVLAVKNVDSDGRYAFSLLRSGEYAVRFTLPQSMLLADQTQGEKTSSAMVVPGYVGMTQRFALGMGETRDNVNVGGILPGEIGDTVWLDVNANGLQDYQEPLLSGVKLTLLRVTGEGDMLETETVESDEYGYYHFRSLRPGSYVLSVEGKAGDELTVHVGAPLGEIDSDILPETGMSEIIRLQSGQTLRNVDVGFAAYGD